MMSSFNPLSRTLAPDEWRQIAHDAIEQADRSHTVVMGGFLGLLAGAAVSPITRNLGLHLLRSQGVERQQRNRSQRPSRPNLRLCRSRPQR